MHEQEFERSVQQKMEELSFTPPAPVWERVQQEIRPNKKRRVAFWMLPLALLLAGGGWWYLQQAGVHQNGTADEINSSVASGTHQTQDQNFKQEENKQAAPVTKSGQNIAGTNYKVPEVNRTGNKAHDPQTSPGPATIIAEANVGYKNIGARDQKNNTKQPVNFSAEEKKQSVVSMPDGAHDAADLKALIPVPLLPAAKAAKLLDVQGAQKQKNASAVKMPAVVKNKKWQWGINVQYGRSGLADEQLFGNAAAADQLGWVAPSFAAVGPMLQPKETELFHGSFFSGGFTVQRRLSKKISLQSGLQYARLSTRQQVGSSVNRSALPNSTTFERLQGNVFFIRDTVKTSYYNNRYHLLSLPLALQVKPFRNLPLEASIGLQAGYIVGAKSLQYDTTSHLYFEGAPPMRRMQWGANAALQYRVASRGAWDLLAGPQVTYHFSSLNPAGAAQKQFYTYSVGVQLRKK